MAEYIEREALIKTWCGLCKRLSGKDENDIECRGCLWRTAIEMSPAADVVEVRHGEWVGDAFDDVLVCKECSYEHALYVLGKLSASNYCPNCGAKMDGKDGAE